jgi:hypothetical protein
MQVFKSERNALLAIAAAFLYWYVLYLLALFIADFEVAVEMFQLLRPFYEFF